MNEAEVTLVDELRVSALECARRARHAEGEMEGLLAKNYAAAALSLTQAVCTVVRAR